ncbi:acyl carrier protein [Hydrogenophaga aquatica]
MNSIDLIRNFLTERLGVEPEKILADAQLADLGVDSLMLAELMFEAEDRLGIEISSDQTPPKTVGDMMSIIDNLAAARTA